MPEVPANMQHGLANLELEASSVYRQNSTASMAAPAHDQYGQPQQYNQSQGYNGGYTQNDGATPYQSHDQNYSYNNAPAQPLHAPPPLPHRSLSYNAPLPSPFPALINPSPNVPPSDEQKEEDLEHSREAVLNSNDPERQLNWAQAALHWSDNAIQARIRAAVGFDKGRPVTPSVERKIREDALQVVSFLADQGHPKADFLRSTWYEFGKFGYPEDTKEAFAGYRRAGEKGYARAEYRMGTKYEAMKDMANAIQHYQQGVANGDSASNYRMGMMALLGQHGQPQNFEAAVSMIRFAADTADENAPQGAYVYGMLLARELPNIVLPEYVLPYDAESARHYIERAAFLGFAKAQLKMGSAFELCLLGCEFDPRLSLHYNRLAAGQGEPEAEMAISKWFLCGYEGVFAKNEELAFQYAKRAAQQEYPTAEFALGYFYELGLVTPMDLGKGREYYQKAADHGNTDAPARLNALSLQRTLSRKDHEQVALSKIKSQYGSRRGQRPDHLVKKAAAVTPALTSMPERNDDSPVNGTFPPRGSSAAIVPPFRVVTPQPLPEVPQTSPFQFVPSSDSEYSRGSSDSYARGRTHQRNGSTGQLLTAFPGQNGALPPRPRSAAPYPQEDRRPTSSGLSIAGPAADRPNSAFGIRPLNNNVPLGPPSPGLRPSSSSSNLGQQPNRPAPSGPNGQQLPYRGHTPTVPDVQKRDEKPTTKDWESQYRLPYKGAPAQEGRGKLHKQAPQGQQPNAQAPARPQQPPAIQTSYDNGPGPNRQGAQSAQPPQQRQESMLNANNRPHSAYPDQQRPVSTMGGSHNNHSLHPSQQQQRPGSSQHSQSFPNQRPTTSGGQQPGMLSHQNTFPERRSSMMPPAQQQQYQQPQQQAPAMTISPAPSQQAARPPPKKGPQTFEEMGVPAAPKESECVSRILREVAHKCGVEANMNDRC